MKFSVVHSTHYISCKGEKSKRKRTETSDSEDSEASAERIHDKKKWRVELSDEQLDILLKNSDFKAKVQRRLRRRSAVKRLQRSSKKLRRKSRSSKARLPSTTETDSSEGESRKATIPLSKPNNNKEGDVMADIDRLLKDSDDESQDDGQDWKARAKVLDEKALRRVSRRFSAELEEMDGMEILKNHSNTGSFLFQLTRGKRTRRLQTRGCEDVWKEVSNTVIQGPYFYDYDQESCYAEKESKAKERHNDEASDEKLSPLLTLFYYKTIYSRIYYSILLVLLNTHLMGSMPRVSLDYVVLGSSLSTLVL